MPHIIHPAGTMYNMYTPRRICHICILDFLMSFVWLMDTISSQCCLFKSHNAWLNTVMFAYKWIPFWENAFKCVPNMWCCYPTLYLCISDVIFSDHSGHKTNVLKNLVVEQFVDQTHYCNAFISGLLVPFVVSHSGVLMEHNYSYAA